MNLARLILTTTATGATTVDRPPAEIVDVEGTLVGGGWLDGDHDGVDDLAVATVETPGSAQVLTRGTTAAPIAVPLPPGVGDLRHLLIAKDPDGGTFEVASFENSALGTFHMIHATWGASGFVVDWSEIGRTDAAVAGDVDGDGHTDLWAWTGGPALRLSGSGTWVELPEFVRDDRLSNVEPVSDVDGDGFDDVLASFVWPDLEVGYQPIGGHAGLYRGSPTGLEPEPLWELGSDDLPIPDLRVGTTAVGLGDGRMALGLTRADEGGCDGADWIAVVYDADTATPSVAQIVDLPFDDDCRPTRLSPGTSPTGDPAVVAYGDGGVHWLNWEPVAGTLPDVPDATWIPDDVALHGEAPPFATDPMAFVVWSEATDAQAVAVWAPLHVGPTPPPGTDDAPQVDQQLVIVSTPEGTTCWCGVVPAAGGVWMSLAGLAAVRARTRRRATA